MKKNEKTLVKKRTIKEQESEKQKMALGIECKSLKILGGREARNQKWKSTGEKNYLNRSDGCI